MRKEHIKAHTGLRGIAAALVALLHMHFEEIIPNQFWEPFIGVAVSWYPVDVFFMLSGFILGYVYVSDIQKPKIDYKDYLVKRFARVAPLHYLTILGAGVMALVALYFDLPNRGYHLSEILPQLLMVHAYPIIGNGGWNGPSWSISMEFFAYLFLFPLVFTLVAKTGKNYLLILLYFIALAIIWAVSDHSTRGWPAITRITCHFSIGYLLYALTTFKNPALQVASKFVSLWLLLAIVWMFMQNLFSQTTSRLLFQAIFALLILGSADNKSSLAKTILANKVFLWLGIISYSIYMIHGLIGKVIHVCVGKISDDLLIQVFVVIGAYVFLLVVSWVSYQFFEVPARNYVTKISSKFKKLKPNE